MFESLTENLQATFRKLTGRGKLTESNIKEGMREIRKALLEADVSYKVVKDFVEHVTERAVGQEVIQSIAPGQQIVKIVHEEIERLMGNGDSRIPYKSPGPTVIMLSGLQGSGKTTTAGKLAQFIRGQGHSPLLVAADIQRPAAVHQLQVLGGQLEIPVFAEQNMPVTRICQHAIDHARENARDVVIMDTAGRLHIDGAMMDELREIAERISPDQIYLVCDAMTGQDAVNSAAEFDQQLSLSGIILTKLDGDARGGAALSIRAVTGKPIKFVGVGEKLDALEPFHPERMASRILGMGDVVSLVEKAQETIDEEEAKKLEEKIRKSSINLEDFLGQLQQIKKMGSLKDLLGMIPGIGSKMKGLDVDDKQLTRTEALIYSMTPQERHHPDLIDGSRRTRIAAGSGLAIQDVNDLLKQFRMMKKTLKRFGGMGDMGDMMSMGEGGMGMSPFGAPRRSKTKSKRKDKKKRRKRR